MEEEKFPSRSDRRKKKTGMFSDKNEIPVDNKEQQREILVGDTEKPADTASAADILEWYFSSAEEAEAVGEDEADAPAVDEPGAGVPIVVAEEAIPAYAEERESTRVDKERARNEKRQKEKTGKSKKVNPVITVILAILMLFGGTAVGYSAVGAMLPAPSPTGDAGNNINILLLGCDEREGDTSARSDVIIVATIRPDVKEVGLLSIPRDTRVAIPGHGMDKINHSMAYGGTDMVKATVENFLQIPIHHVVKVNFDGFINVIDALGGVNLEVPCRMYKPLEAIDLLPGYQTLDGADALAFVRWRGDGTGDYGRIERQQQFISALTEKVKKMNLKQALNVANAVMDSIETDMGVRQMVNYGMNVIGMDAGSVKTYSYTGNSVYIGGVNYVEPNMDEVARIVHEMQYGKQETVAE